MPKRKILVVDDIEGMASNLCLMLARQGYQATVAMNGQEALELIQRELFDLIITDVVMAVMDGPTLIDRINGLRNRGDQHGDAQIIVYTVCTDGELTPYRDLFAKTGAVVVNKMDGMTSLLDALQQAFSLKDAEAV